MKKSLFAVSMMTLGILYGLLAALAILVCKLCGASALAAVIAAIVAIALQFLIGPWLTDLSMRWFYKANFKAELPEYLTAFVADVCGRHNMKMPKIGLIDDGAPNAYTYGRTKNDARVIITRGTLELLSEDEVKAVVAHELGHASHYDMLFMTVAQIVPLIMYGIYEACMKAAASGKKSGSRESDSDSKAGTALAVIGIIAYVLYLICQLIILWLSRTREYYADEFSVRETGDPEALSKALVLIGYGLSTIGKTGTDNRHSAASPTTLGIADASSSKAMAVCTAGTSDTDTRTIIQNAMKWDMWNVWAKLYELGSTHPLISKRLLAIAALAPEYGQEPYISFDLEKPESYVDDFFKEIAISALPYLFLIAGIVCCIAVERLRLMWLLGGVAMCLAASLFKFIYSHPAKCDAKKSVSDLLGEVKVSGITSVPCEVNGEIIGRGNPGCIFNEDFVLQDETGIVMLDYKQPLFIINKIFALFKSEKYFGKITRVEGWYRRNPVPYVEVKAMETDGKVRKCYTYQLGLILRAVGTALAVAGTVIVLIAG